MPEAAAGHPGLSDILGQDRAVSTLLEAFAAGRLHHAWIFSGPAGVGKATTALAFASLILDPTTAPDLTGRIAPDPDSTVQRLLAAGTHPDLHVITKELALLSSSTELRDRKLTNIPIDVLRERMIGGWTGPADSPRFFESIVGKASMMGHNKVFIIDEAELLQEGAQNALLKTVEEPPPDTFIFLITASEDRLLPTMRSRCRRVGFNALDEKAMKVWFERAQLDLAPDERRWIEWFAAGSPGRALIAAETGLFNWAKELTPLLDDLDRPRPRVDAMLGQTMATLVQDWAEAQVKGNRSASKEAANHLASDLMVWMLSERTRGRLREAASRRGPHNPEVARCLNMLEAIADARRHMHANVSPQFVFENLAARLGSPADPSLF